VRLRRALESRLAPPLAALLLAVALVGAPAGAAPPRVERPPAAALAASAVEAVSSEEAYDHVQALSDQIGSRPGHTQAYFAAVAYAYERLTENGYRVTVEDFTYRHWEDRGSYLEVDGGRVDGRALRWSGSGDVSAPLVEVGLARPSDLAGRRLDGQIALARRGEITFAAKAENVQAAGALGLVVFNHESGELNGSLSGPHPEGARFPVLGVTAAEGERLRGVAGRGGAAQLVAAAGVQERLSSNVIAHGGGGPGRVLVGAHLDSVPMGPGANDNASGSAAVLELARVFAGRPEQARLSLALFGAEEDGLIGSQRHVARIGAEGTRQYRAMLNLDMVAVGDRFEVGTSGERSRDLAQRAVDAGRGLGLRIGQFDAGGASDHAPFAQAGVPTLMFHWREDPNYHRPTDTAGRIDPEKLAATTRVVAQMVAELLAS
jgi:Iap family predicted aminopeptidase